MELLAVVLSGFMAIISPLNFGGEMIAAQQLKQQLVSAEDLTVRIDNTPSYQIVQGKIDRVRIAGKGLVPIKDIRIAQLDIETDPIALKGLRAKLAQPLQAGINLILTEADINRALQSPTILNQLKQIGGQALGSQAARQINRYTFSNPRLTLLGEQRLNIKVDLKERGYPDILTLEIETDIAVESGKLLKLENTSITANGQPLYAPLTRRIIAGVNRQLDLDKLERLGMTARLLKLSFQAKQIQATSFVQVRPEAVSKLQRFRPKPMQTGRNARPQLQSDRGPLPIAANPQSN